MWKNRGIAKELGILRKIFPVILMKRPSAVVSAQSSPMDEFDFMLNLRAVDLLGLLIFFFLCNAAQPETNQDDKESNRCSDELGGVDPRVRADPNKVCGQRHKG